MARKISFKQAVNEAIAQEMRRDETVIVMGEDNVGGMGSDGERDAWGGVLGVTKGLYGKFGDRVMDTPISESAFVGAAIGAAACGLRPVVELMFVDSWESASTKSSIRPPNFVICSAVKQ
jgi:acetoin:2,6-dichlorophenolindophenol oxidoreductase subunit beta